MIAIFDCSINFYPFLFSIRTLGKNSDFYEEATKLKYASIFFLLASHTRATLHGTKES